MATVRAKKILWRGQNGFIGDMPVATVSNTVTVKLEPRLFVYCLVTNKGQSYRSRSNANVKKAKAFAQQQLNDFVQQISEVVE